MNNSTEKITKLTLVRHGTTEWMEQGITHGHLDAPLSKRGVGEAQATADLLRGRSYDAIYCSPSGRAMQTAQIIGASVQLQPTPLNGLMEHHFGVLEGKPILWTPNRAQLRKELILGWFVPVWKGGESFSVMYRRVRGTLAQVVRQHSGGKVLLVSHHGVINVILRTISKRPFSLFKIPPAGVVEIEMDDKGRGTILSDVKIAF